MAISDEEVVKQLESVPQVEPPDMRAAVMGRLRSAASQAAPPAQSRRHLLAGLPWASAIVIVVAVVYVARNPLPREHTEATMAPLPYDRWIVVIGTGVPQLG